jgi:hypothetical protein
MHLARSSSDAKTAEALPNEGLVILSVLNFVAGHLEAGQENTASVAFSATVSVFRIAVALDQLHFGTERWRCYFCIIENDSARH